MILKVLFWTYIIQLIAVFLGLGLDGFETKKSFVYNLIPFWFVVLIGKGVCDKYQELD
jgi:hypothetical protein